MDARISTNSMLSPPRPSRKTPLLARERLSQEQGTSPPRSTHRVKRKLDYGPSESFLGTMQHCKRAGVRKNSLVMKK